MLKLLQGGYEIRPEDKAILNKQRAITKKINDQYVQVGAVFLKASSKSPYDEEGWFNATRGQTDLQSWIDDEALAQHNVGFNLQLGWVDIDIDAEDPIFNQCIISALDYIGIDTRFRFGRRSVGAPTHVLVQLGEEESAAFDVLKKFAPKEFFYNDKKYHVDLRSVPTKIEEKNLYKSAKQTVMPGSIYSHDTKPNDYDISVWYGRDNSIAENVRSIAETTPRIAPFNHIVRAIAFGVLLYMIKDHWVSGTRQATAVKLGGWLARVVQDSQAMNNQPAVANDVFCPIDDDQIAEKLIKFICEIMDDDEPHMRIRSYYDAVDKLARNPDAKIPGWPAMEELVGGSALLAIRTVVMPGSDVSVLTKMAERYIYDETDNKYIDRLRHSLPSGIFIHEGHELERRHRGDTIKIAGKPREAFSIFERSDMRKRVAMRNLYPDLSPGGIFRINVMGHPVPDDSEENSMTVFNTWRGWPIEPASKVDPKLMAECEAKLDRLLGYLTSDNPNQIEWIKDWVAWTFQHPGKKQQIALVVVGGQGVGKSFFGNLFIPALMGPLWGAASPKVLEGDFSIEPFIGNMFTFMDEAKFTNQAGVDEIKKLIRSVKIGGAEKFESARTHNIYSRVMFASNHMNINIGQQNTKDRALFYTIAYDHVSKGMTETEFRSWTVTLKPWFDEFTEFLDRKDVLQHYMRLFMDRKCDRHEIEDIKYSSSSDQRIVTANMSMTRRIAKQIIEEGRIFEDIAIEYPFTLTELRAEINRITRDQGLRNIGAERVLAEWQDAGLIHDVATGSGRKMAFKYNHGELVDRFGAYIGVDLERLFEFTEKDMGENSFDPTTAVPPPWRGRKGPVPGTRF